MNFMASIDRFRKDRKGATATEYGLITALLSVVIMVALNALGIELNETFAFIGETLRSA